MTSRIPIVDASLLGAENWITDFIQVGNPKLRRIAAHIRGDCPDEIIQSVMAYVAKKIRYPLDFMGRPTAAHSAKVYKWWNGLYLHSRNSDYGWLFPSQVLEAKAGICFDSSCLTTTLLRIKRVRAWTVMGVTLRTKSKRVLTSHAWTEAVKDDLAHVVIETTVHPKPGKLVLAEELYQGVFPVTYDPCAWFNESVYREVTEKLEKYKELMQ